MTLAHRTQAVQFDGNRVFWPERSILYSQPPLGLSLPYRRRADDTNHDARHCASWPSEYLQRAPQQAHELIQTNACLKHHHPRDSPVQTGMSAMTVPRILAGWGGA